MMSLIKTIKAAFLFYLFILVGCQSKKNVWSVNFANVTSSSSIKCADLNNDGIKDIVIGAGGNEWEKTDAGILAIDGKNGVKIWQAKARNQIVGSAVFLDINADKTVDVIIGGRSAELQVLDGKTGKLIWEFYTKPGKLSAYDEGWFNFFNPQIVLDQNNDGIKDILICNGGNALLEAGSKNRPAGKVLLLSGKSGEILAADLSPDGHEIYSTPVCIDCDTNHNPKFIFGTGGETQGGNLFITDLNSLKNKNIKSAKILASSSEKGFISPPILADFNLDKTLDIVVNQANGTTLLIDGKNFKQIWRLKIDSSEVYSQPAVGHFVGNDKYLDVFVSYALGKYPDYKQNTNYLINGKTGKVVLKNSYGKFTYSSPLVADLDANGTDEILLNTINDYEERNQQKPYYQIRQLNIEKNRFESFSSKQYGACFASSPWLGDLDNNGKLDLVYSGSPAIISAFPGTTTYVKPALLLQLHREEFKKISPKDVKWGQYLGAGGRSILN